MASNYPPGVTEADIDEQYFEDYLLGGEDVELRSD